MKKGYRYFGVENGDSCYCGSDDTKFVPVPTFECNQRCSGNQDQICGGSWRLSVYGPVITTSTTTKTTSTEEITTTYILDTTEATTESTG